MLVTLPPHPIVNKGVRGPLPGTRDRAYIHQVCGSAHAIRIEDLSPLFDLVRRPLARQRKASHLPAQSRAPLRRGFLLFTPLARPGSR